MILTSLWGCNDPEPRPARCSDFTGTTQLPDVPLAYSTEHLDIHVDDDRMFCAGSAVEYERFFQYVGRELELELPARVPVFLTDAIGDYCADGLPGCRTVDGVVFANPGSTIHELTHAATCEWRSSSSKYLSEGLAVSFESTPLTFKSDPRDFITIGETTEFKVHYSEAGHFVRWLLDDGGPRRLRELYETSPRAGGEGVLDALASAYGRAPDAIFADFAASAPYMWVPHRQCDDVDALPFSDGGWELDTIFDCSDPSTHGPWERLGRQTHLYVDAGTSMYQSFLLEIESSGVYRFEREPDTGVWIERCIDEVALSEDQAAQLWLREGLFADLQGTTAIELTAGTYRIDVRRQYAEPHPVWLRIEADPG